MIVEDDPLVAMMLEDYLELLGHQPVACADGIDSALAELASSDIDAAIIDVYLANGETSGPIAEKLAAGAIPFLISTGGFIAERAPVFADRPVLMKPFTAKSLNQAITGLVGSAHDRGM